MSSVVKSVAVTGAGGSLGKVVVAELFGAGYSVHASYRRQQSVSDQPNLEQYICELGDSKAVADLFATIIAKTGEMPAVVNVAGGFRYGEVVDLSIADFDFLFDANFRSVFNLLQHAIPRMRTNGGGQLIFVSSLSSLRLGETGMGVYNASKSALNALIKSAASENHRYGIRINALCPSIIDTPTNRAAMPDADASNWVSCRLLSQQIRLLLTTDLFNGVLVPS